ncbi:hypothetical protein BDF19DRAFT_227236 [Syncephalis fuscata]|nr:hypothetical protein BDF19DRAFT_227236 [Syncephalis fuscata]
MHTHALLNTQLFPSTSTYLQYHLRLILRIADDMASINSFTSKYNRRLEAVEYKVLNSNEASAPLHVNNNNTSRLYSSTKSSFTIQPAPNTKARLAAQLARYQVARSPSPNHPVAAAKATQLSNGYASGYSAPWTEFELGALPPPSSPRLSPSSMISLQDTAPATPSSDISYISQRSPMFSRNVETAMSNMPPDFGRAKSTQSASNSPDKSVFIVRTGDVSNESSIVNNTYSSRRASMVANLQKQQTANRIRSLENVGHQSKDSYNDVPQLSPLRPIDLNLLASDTDISELMNNMTLEQARSIQYQSSDNAPVYNNAPSRPVEASMETVQKVQSSASMAFGNKGKTTGNHKNLTLVNPTAYASHLVYMNKMANGAIPKQRARHRSF